MDLALYAPEVGYYARAARRSGRAGDFVTSVDVGSVFGALLAERFAAWWRSMAMGWRDRRASTLSRQPPATAVSPGTSSTPPRCGNPPFYEAIAAHLVERSQQARAAQHDVLASHGPASHRRGTRCRPASTASCSPTSCWMPSPSTSSRWGRRASEIYVDLESGRLAERPGPLSSPALADYLAGAGVTLRSGARAEINLAAVDWVAGAAARIRRGFLVLIDYGYEAAELYSEARARGTLATYHRHLVDASEPVSTPAPRGLPTRGTAI